MESFRLSRGFTLTEMLVVLSIIVVITGVALSSQSSFNKSVIVSNTAYDIALALRAAETYGIGSRVAGASSNAGYGIHLSRATPSSFLLFVDTYPAPSVASPCHPAPDENSPAAKPGNCSYDESQSERVTSYQLGNGVTISDFCAYALGSWSCANSNGSALSTLDIVFARPNPEPYMSVNGAYSVLFPVTAACLVVSSPQGGARYISVGAAGQITANANSCP